ncbi:MAG: hypothetical protein N2690_01235 [Rhodocyclaceae bacterium]|nr:hypothetical protein [Rhodocyclaceae bacterium]
MPRHESKLEDVFAQEDTISATELALLNELLGDASSQPDEPPAEAAQPADLQALYAAALEQSREALREFQASDDVLTGLFGAQEGSTPEIDETDFDPEQRPVFRTLRAHLRTLVSKSTRDAARLGELNWMMGPFPDRHGLCFEDACRMLMCRPSVVRTRALYEMWRVGLQVHGALSPLSKGLPRFLADELELNPRLARIKSAVALGRVVWSMPGRPLQEVFERAREQGVAAAPQTFDALELEGFVAKVESLPQMPVYFVARNPTLLGYTRRANFSWALSMALADD